MAARPGSYTCDYTVPAHVDGENDPIVNTATRGEDLDGDAVTGDTDTASVDIDPRPRAR